MSKLEELRSVLPGEVQYDLQKLSEHLGTDGWSIAFEPSEQALFDACLEVDADSTNLYFVTSLHKKCLETIESCIRFLDESMRKAFVTAVPTKQFVHILDTSSDVDELKAHFANGRVEFRGPAKAFAGYNKGESCGRYLLEGLEAFIEGGGLPGPNPLVQALKEKCSIDYEKGKMEEETGVGGWTIEMEPSEDAIFAACCAVDRDTTKMYFFESLHKKCMDTMATNTRFLDDAMKQALVKAVPTKTLVHILDTDSDADELVAHFANDRIEFRGPAKAFTGYSKGENCGRTLEAGLTAFIESGGLGAGANPMVQALKDKCNIDHEQSQMKEYLGVDGWTIEMEPSEDAIFAAACAVDEHNTKMYFFESLWKKCLGTIATNARFLEPAMQKALVEAVPTKTLVHILDTDSNADELVAHFANDRIEFRGSAAAFAGYNKGENCGRTLKDGLTAFIESGGGGGGGPNPMVTALREKCEIAFEQSQLEEQTGVGGWKVEMEPSEDALFAACCAVDEDSTKMYFFESLWKKCIGTVATNVKFLEKPMRDAVVAAIPSRTFVHILDSSSDADELRARFVNGRCEFRGPAAAFAGYSKGEECGRFFVESLEDYIDEGGIPGPNPMVASLKIKTPIEFEKSQLAEYTGVGGWEVAMEPSEDALWAACCAQDRDTTRLYFLESLWKKCLSSIASTYNVSLKDPQKRKFVETVTTRKIVHVLDHDCGGLEARFVNNRLEFHGSAAAFTGYSVGDDCGKELKKLLKEPEAPKPAAAAAAAPAAAPRPKVAPKRPSGGGPPPGASPAAQLMYRRKELEANCKATIDEVAGTGQFASIPRETLEGWSDAFQKYDEDASGDIDQQELTKMMEAIGMPARVLEVRALMAEFDADQSGSIDFREFLTLCAKRGLSKGMTAPPPKAAAAKAPLWASGPSAGGRVGGGGGSAASAAAAAAPAGPAEKGSYARALELVAMCKKVPGVMAALPNGKAYIIQNGVPYRIIDHKNGEYFSGFKPLVKCISAPNLMQWSNPNDVDGDDLDDKLQAIHDEVMAAAGASAGDSDVGSGTNLFGKSDPKPSNGRKCSLCKATGFGPCTYCHTKGCKVCKNTGRSKSKCIKCKGAGHT